ncbi:xanthine dehydrogenase family protein molybdopterin-binding subunit [Nocardioides caldifontis]|uniref:xanthine dehydrogenase family protein molybdopterin-binding subunit n=1 Tax=Nocardioides caldifontis TaxID=2588938 RepID=UPI0011DFC9D4|nr:xanthine dehydrogenase family protein molybdopterin-binding subunit [Nocardioides caldifontis]
MSDEPQQRPTRPIDVRSVGREHVRVDGRAKVTGTAPYAVEHDLGELLGRELPLLHLWLVTSRIAKGRIESVDASRALAHPGVVHVVDHTNAPRLQGDDEPELLVLQTPRVSFRNEIVAVVAAESLEAAREGAALVDVTYAEEPFSAELTDSTPTYKPDSVNPSMPTDTEEGDVDAAIAAAEVLVEETYRTPFEHNNPMEPHAAMAVWEDDPGGGSRLTMYDSTQGVHGVRSAFAPMLGLEPEQVRVLAPNVGGGFGSKGVPHAPEMAVALTARALPGRAVKLAVTRQQMFSLTGYRTATFSHFRLGADDEGRLQALEHRVVEQTSRLKEYAEQTASPTRMMYAGPNRRTSHRLAMLDVAVPSWMRAPGEMPGAYAQEVAIDDLAVRCGLDPVTLRERNEPEIDPDTGKPFHDRRLVECLRRGAERFGWADRPSEPRSRQEGEWWVGTGVAASSYPMMAMPGNTCRVEALHGGRLAVSIGAVDIGTGAWTVLTQIAADALGCPTEAVVLRIGDSDLPSASVAGGSSGTSSWGSAIVAAAQAFREEHGEAPEVGAVTTAAAEENPEKERYAMHSFGAVFAEARVHRWTGEVRVPRLLGVYSVGRVVNPTTARSQLLGGLTMGLSAALFEEGWRDPRFGHTVTQDLATYHVAAHADVQRLEAEWLDEADTVATPMGSRGIGEIGIVGSPAAVVNAVFHATGVRVRDLPVTPDKLVGQL